MTPRPLPRRHPGCTSQESICFAPAATEAEVDAWRASHACCRPIERTTTSAFLHPGLVDVDVRDRLVVVIVTGVTSQRELEASVEAARDLRGALLGRRAARVEFAWRLAEPVEAP